MVSSARGRRKQGQTLDKFWKVPFACGHSSQITHMCAHIQEHLPTASGCPCSGMWGQTPSRFWISLLRLSHFCHSLLCFWGPVIVVCFAVHLMSCLLETSAFIVHFQTANEDFSVMKWDNLYVFAGTSELKLWCLHDICKMRKKGGFSTLMATYHL